jgi:acid phosphatase (class A)
MRRTAFIVAAALLLTAASGPKVPPPLAAGTIDPALILPAPPAEGSAAALEEVTELHRIQTARTPDQIAHAKADSATKDVSIFNGVMGPDVDLLKMPATAALFALVRAEEKRDADVAKDFFKRKRPWIVDPTLDSCSKDDDEPLTSFPSGHATMGYSMAAVLARLAPSHGPAIMVRAADYAHSRLVCEVHFHADIIAGQALGMIVAERLMQDPGFRRQFDAAKIEIAAIAK